jgi:hypothetical protein
MLVWQRLLSSKHAKKMESEDPIPRTKTCNPTKIVPFLGFFGSHKEAQLVPIEEDQYAYHLIDRTLSTEPIITVRQGEEAAEFFKLINELHQKWFHPRSEEFPGVELEFQENTMFFHKKEELFKLILFFQEVEEYGGVDNWNFEHEGGRRIHLNIPMHPDLCVYSGCH